MICAKYIEFGNNDLVSWNVTIMDSDTHSIVVNGKRINSNREIKIGDKVWGGCESMILKGSVIPNNSVIATKSLITKKYDSPNVVISGHDAKTKYGIDWKNIKGKELRKDGFFYIGNRI